MEGIVSVLMFGLGTAAGVKAVKAARGGLRPVLREAIKGCIIVAETARSVLTRAGSPAASVGSGPHAESPGLQTLTEVTSPVAKGRGRTGPRKIEVVRE